MALWRLVSTRHAPALSLYLRPWRASRNANYATFPQQIGCLAVCKRYRMVENTGLLAQSNSSNKRHGEATHRQGIVKRLLAGPWAPTGLACALNPAPSTDSRRPAPSGSASAARGWARSSAAACECRCADIARRSPYPHLAQNEFVRQYLAGMRDQQAQEIVFLRRELHLLLAHGDDASDQVDGEIAGPEDRFLALLLQAMADRRANARQQLLHAERLRDVVIGSEVESLDLAGLVGPARQHDDGEGRALFPHLTDDRQAIGARQAEVEDHDVDGVAPQHGEGSLAVRCFEQLIALRRQAGAKEAQDLRLVVDCQDAQRV